jgi:outer membrane receptor protein involved in Fe transport
MGSVIAEGYFVHDVVLLYQIKQFDLGLEIQNLFNVEWNEAQFDTESRLQSEPTAVSELHFTPGTPFFVKGSIGVRF